MIAFLNTDNPADSFYTYCHSVICEAWRLWLSSAVCGYIVIVSVYRPTSSELRLSNRRIISLQTVSILRSRCMAEMTSAAVSPTGVRYLLMVLSVAAAAVRTSHCLLTNANCETHINGSLTYHACIADPEHVLQPGIAAFNVTIDPLNNTCGLTLQKFCTLVCISSFVSTIFLAFAVRVMA